MPNPLPRQPRITQVVLPETSAQRYAREQLALGNLIRQRRRQEEAEAAARRQAIAARRRRQFGLSDFELHQLRTHPNYTDLSIQLDQARDTATQQLVLARYRERMADRSAADREILRERAREFLSSKAQTSTPGPQAAAAQPHSGADGHPIPAAAIAHLRANPHLRPQFDAKYRVPGLADTLLA